MLQTTVSDRLNRGLAAITGTPQEQCAAIVQLVRDVRPGVNDIRPVGAKLEELTKAGADPDLIKATRTELLSLINTPPATDSATLALTYPTSITVNQTSITVDQSEYNAIKVVSRITQETQKRKSCNNKSGNKGKISEANISDVDKKLTKADELMISFRDSVPVMSFIMDSLFKLCEKDNGESDRIKEQISRLRLLEPAETLLDTKSDCSALPFIQALGWQSKVAVLEYIKSPKISDIIPLSKAIGNQPNRSGEHLASFIIELVKDEFALLSDSKRRQLINLILFSSSGGSNKSEKLRDLLIFLEDSGEIAKRQASCNQTSQKLPQGTDNNTDYEAPPELTSLVFRRRRPLVHFDFKSVVSNDSKERVTLAHNRAQEILPESCADRVKSDPKKFLSESRAPELVKEELSVFRENNPKAAFTTSAVILASYTGSKAPKADEGSHKWKATSTIQNLIAEAIRNLVILAGDHDLSADELREIFRHTQEEDPFIRTVVQKAFAALSTNQKERLFSMLDLPYGLTDSHLYHLYELFDLHQERPSM